ncbi:MAG: SHOCT domain-containing protein [Alphaproteobacteria bacterium]
MVEPATVSAIGYGDGLMGWGSGFGLGHMFFGGVMMIAFWGTIIVLFLAVHRFSGSGTPQRQDAADRSLVLRRLEEIYAKGDIDRTEFEEKRQTLMQSRGSV